MKPFRGLPSPGLTLFLLLLWLLLNNTLAVGHVVLGLLLGLAIPMLCQRFLAQIPSVHRPVKLVRFTLLVLYDIVVANWAVAQLVLGPRSRLRPAFIEIPVALENDFLRTVLAGIVSLTPGTVSADINSDRQLLLVHVLDSENAQLLVNEIKQRYEAPLLEIFACSNT